MACFHPKEPYCACMDYEEDPEGLEDDSEFGPSQFDGKQHR